MSRNKVRKGLTKGVYCRDGVSEDNGVKGGVLGYSERKRGRR